MADIPINPVTRRVEFTGNTGTGPFAFTFNVLAQADVAAYKNNTLLALTSDYTVSLNSNGTGSITLASALIATDELVIIGDLALSRTTDFVTAGDLLASSLNEQFDSNVVMSQQLDERFDRTIRSQPGDINKNLYLPLVSSRASQLLSFDSSGNITTTSLSNVPDIGTVNLTVSGVASFADGSASAPSITNIGDTNTGMYFGAADQINFSVGGSEVISVASTGTTISGLSISSGDILLTDNSATALEIKEGSNNYLTFITTNGSEKISFGSTANPTFEVNGSFRQPLIAATTSFFSQTYSGATLSATNGAVNIESYSASKAGIVLNGSGDQITFTSPTLGFVGLVQVVGAITTNTSLNIASSTTVTGILDEDDMASNSATKLATQQSIKAYVDAQVGTVDTLAEVLGNGNTTGSNNIIVTAGQSITVDTISETTAANGVVIDGVTLKDGGATVTADVTFGDNDKAIFGAGSDLQIYHDGLHSYIEEAGTGRLHFKSNSYVFYNAAGTERAIDFLENDEVRLYFDGSEKLATTSTGVDITGTITSDGLTVDGTASIQPSSASIPSGGNTSADDLIVQSSGHTGMTIGSGTSSTGSIYFADSGSNSIGRIQYNHTDNSLYLQTNAEKRLNIASTGDISFFEDTGTTAKLFWDASAESLGIGTSSPNQLLELRNTSGDFGAEATIRGSTSVGGPKAEIAFKRESSGDDTSIVFRPSDNGTLNATAMTLNSSGNVGIGTASPNFTLQLDSQRADATFDANDLDTWADFKIQGQTSSGNARGIYFDFDSDTGNDKGAGIVGISGDGTGGVGSLGFITTAGNSSAERMRITSAGKVGIGTDAPQGTVVVQASDAKLGVDNDGSKHLEMGIGSGGCSFMMTTGHTMAFGHQPYANRGSDTNFSEKMKLDASGNVGIGVTPKAWGTAFPSVLQIGAAASLTTSGGDNARLLGNVWYNGTNYKRITSGFAHQYEQTGGTHRWSYAATGAADSTISFSEAMRIDSSGNLLVSKTSVDSGVVGVEAKANGTLVATVNGDTVSLLNRKTSDGEILRLQKDGTTAGSLGVNGGDLYIENSTTGIIFNNAHNSIIPTTTGGVVDDGNQDLGISSHRWRNLHLSGGIQFDARSNKLDDYEEGLFDVTLSTTGGTVTLNSVYNKMSYTKIGRQVTVFGLIITSSVSSPTGAYAHIDSLPFTSANLTEGSGRSGGGIFYWDGANAHVKPWEISESSNRLSIYMDASTLTSGDDFYFSCTYQTT